MKKFIINVIIAFAVGLLAPHMAQAQGTLYVSNLGQTPTGSASIGSDAWIAQAFRTGANSGVYTLNSIELLMDAASGNPSGFTVSIYSSIHPNVPNITLGNLAGSLDPSSGGIFTYTASGITLSPLTFYYVVLTAATPVVQRAYVWSAVTDYTNGDDYWGIGDLYYSSIDGTRWVGHTSPVFQLAIYATDVPEPSVEMLFGLGGILLLGLGRWKAKAF